MKKIVGILVAAAIAIAFVGCDTVGVTGNDIALTGTWTAKSVTVGNTSLVPAASTKEGTWEYKTVSYPSVETSTTTTTGGATTITINRSDNTTVTSSIKRVIAADGSMVQTTTVVSDVGSKTPIASSTSGTVTTNYTNNAAVTASTTTWTQVKTVTVTVVGTDYKENTKTVDSVTYVSAGATSTDVKTQESNSYVQTANSLTFYTVSTFASVSSPSFFSGGMAAGALSVSGSLERTIAGTTPTQKGIQYTTTTTYTLAVLEAGTYTYTTTVVKDVPAQDAVTGTYTVSGQSAVAAGTRTSTTVETGVLTTKHTLTGTDTSATDTAYFAATAKTEAHVGTGSQVSELATTLLSDWADSYAMYWPTTSVTRNVDYSTSIATYTVVKGAGTDALTKLLMAPPSASTLVWTLAAN